MSLIVRAAPSKDQDDILHVFLSAVTDFYGICHIIRALLQFRHARPDHHNFPTVLHA